MTEVKDRGLTWRAILAVLFVVFVIQPAIVYNWLVSGLWGLPLQSWAVILLWVGLARLLGSSLNSKEIFIIRMVETTGLMFTGYYFAYLLRNQYFANSEIAMLFGMQNQIPSFFSPLGEAAERSMLNRTFLDVAWALPILVSVIIPVILVAVANYVLGLLAFRLYVQEEKLEFPIASWDARTMKAFGERDRRLIRYVTLAIIGGLLYSLMSQGLTTILGVPLFPRYTIDLTSIVESILPGASFSFTLDLLSYVIGFILPIQFTAAQFIASLALYVFGNHYVTINNLWPEESKWQAGQGYLWLYQRSTLYFWNSFTIGWGIAMAIVPLLVRYKSVARAFSRVGSGLGEKEKGSRLLSSKYLLLIYLATAGASILVTKILIPDFPLWVLVIFTLGISFIMTLLQTHSAGVTAGFNVPYLRETMIYFSGYSKIDIWFMPPEMMLFLGGSGIAQQLKQASLLGVEIREYTKAYFLMVFLGLLGSFIFVSLFWSLSPIPGWAYPYTISAWPVEALNFWRWQTWLWSGYLFRREMMFMGMGISTVIYLISDLAFHIPSFPIAMMTGMLMVPNIALAQFVGSLMSIAIRKFMGRRMWEENKGFIVIGLTLGDSLFSTILRVLTLIGRSIWLKPY
ncbi:MAG: hypothetical protein QXT26_00565 [Thermoproteota archaeon]